ncbi:MAG: hypothetical protein ACI87E_005153 [Mariniblastus sp.]|jgi:hypothetical protein
MDDRQMGPSLTQRLCKSKCHTPLTVHLISTYDDPVDYAARQESILRYVLISGEPRTPPFVCNVISNDVGLIQEPKISVPKY